MTIRAFLAAFVLVLAVSVVTQQLSNTVRVSQQPNQLSVFCRDDADCPGRVPGESGRCTGGLCDVTACAMGFCGSSPMITSVTPSQGPETGETRVTIKGLYLTDTYFVEFGGSPASNLVVVSDTEITVDTPAHSPGYAYVRAYVTGKPSATLANGYLYIAVGQGQSCGPPQDSTVCSSGLVCSTSTFQCVTPLIPTPDPPFTGYLPQCEADYDCSEGETCVLNDFEDNCSVEDRVGIGAVCFWGECLTLPCLTDLSGNEICKPKISGIVPSSGPYTGGTQVTVVGENFTGLNGHFSIPPWVTMTSCFSTIGETFVRLERSVSSYLLPGQYRVDSAEQITLVTPPCPFFENAHMANINIGIPGIMYWQPSHEFELTAGTSTGPACILADNSCLGPSGDPEGDDLLTCCSPNECDEGICTLPSEGNEDPIIISVTPNTGWCYGGDDPVTITGENFYDVSAVHFGGEDATSFSVDSPTQITVVTPNIHASSWLGDSIAPSVVDVEVTTADGTARLQTAYTYTCAACRPEGVSCGLDTGDSPCCGGDCHPITGVCEAGSCPAPEITSITPPETAFGQGVFATIRGRNFLQGMRVYLKKGNTFVRELGGGSGTWEYRNGLYMTDEIRNLSISPEVPQRVDVVVQQCSPIKEATLVGGFEFLTASTTLTPEEQCERATGFPSASFSMGSVPNVMNAEIACAQMMVKCYTFCSLNEQTNVCTCTGRNEICNEGQSCVPPVSGVITVTDPPLCMVCPGSESSSGFSSPPPQCRDEGEGCMADGDCCSALECNAQSRVCSQPCEPTITAINPTSDEDADGGGVYVVVSGTNFDTGTTFSFLYPSANNVSPTTGIPVSANIVNASMAILSVEPLTPGTMYLKAVNACGSSEIDTEIHSFTFVATPSSLPSTSTPGGTTTSVPSGTNNSTTASQPAASTPGGTTSSDSATSPGGTTTSTPSSTNNSTPASLPAASTPGGTNNSVPSGTNNSTTASLPSASTPGGTNNSVPSGTNNSTAVSLPPTIPPFAPPLPGLPPPDLPPPRPPTSVVLTCATCGTCQDCEHPAQCALRSLNEKGKNECIQDWVQLGNQIGVKCIPNPEECPMVRPPAEDPPTFAWIPVDPLEPPAHPAAPSSPPGTTSSTESSTEAGSSADSSDDANLVPEILSVDPKSGSVEGDEIVIIKGKNLRAKTPKSNNDVKFGDTPVVNIYGSPSDTTWMVKNPPHGAGEVKVTVDTINGKAGLNQNENNGFTYLAVSSAAASEDASETASVAASAAASAEASAVASLPADPQSPTEFCCHSSAVTPFCEEVPKKTCTELLVSKSFFNSGQCAQHCADTNFTGLVCDPQSRQCKEEQINTKNETGRRRYIFATTADGRRGCAKYCNDPGEPSAGGQGGGAPNVGGQGGGAGGAPVAALSPLANCRKVNGETDVGNTNPFESMTVGGEAYFGGVAGQGGRYSWYIGPFSPVQQNPMLARFRKDAWGDCFVDYCTCYATEPFCFGGWKQWRPSGTNRIDYCPYTPGGGVPQPGWLQPGLGAGVVGFRPLPNPGANFVLTVPTYFYDGPSPVPGDPRPYMVYKMTVPGLGIQETHRVAYQPLPNGGRLPVVVGPLPGFQGTRLVYYRNFNVPGEVWVESRY